MIPKKMIVAPGLEVDAIQTEHFKTEALSICVTVPLDRHTVPLYGLALSVLKRGTELYSTIGAINRRLDELYASGVSLRVDRFGNNCVIGFSAEMLGEAYTDGKTDVFGGVVDVIMQMLFHPMTDDQGLLLAQFVESEKNIACDAIEASDNNPRARAARRCREIMFANDDFGTSLSGTVEQIRTVTPESLTTAYRNLLTKRTFRVFYVGEKSIEDVAKRVLRLLKPYLSMGGAYKAITEGVSCDPLPVKRVNEMTAVAQGKLVMGFRTGVNVRHEDFCAMLILSEIYGGSPISKLFMNVRERLGLCYYCGSTYDIYKGTMFVSCGVDPENRDMAESEILRQLDEIRHGNIREEEFDAAVKALVSSYRAISDLPATLESYYLGRDLFGVSCSVSACMEGIRRVSREDVIRLANRIVLDTVYFLCGEKSEDGEDDVDEML